METQTNGGWRICHKMAGPDNMLAVGFAKIEIMWARPSLKLPKKEVRQHRDYPRSCHRRQQQSRIPWVTDVRRKCQTQYCIALCELCSDAQIDAK